MKRILVNISDELLEALDAAGKASGEWRSALIERLLWDGLKKPKRERPKRPRKYERRAQKATPPI